MIGLLGAAAVWPLTARAQPATPTIGFLNPASPHLFASRVAAFHQGLREIGYIEGQNVAIDYRWAEGQYDRLPGLAADLARRQVSVIAATGGIPSALAAKASTTTIPIVFVAGADPVKFGVVTNLNRPGGNITGLTALTSELVPKRLQLVREMVPTATIIAMLVNPANPIAEAVSNEVQVVARTLGLQLHVLHASTERDLNSVFATLVQLRATALLIVTDTFFDSMSDQLAALTVRHSVPAIYQTREFAAAGGLMSYGGSLTDAYRRAGVYTGRILKGERSGDLPVQRSTKIELFINLKTAKTLNLTVPPTLLASADEVIE